MQTSSVTEIYGTDHDRLDELFHRFHALNGSDWPEAAQAFTEFKAGLEQHIRWEEEILFPPLEAKMGQSPDSWAAIMRWEHQHLRQYLARIEQHIAQRDTDAELERIAFVSLLGSHNQKEERIVYPMIDQTVGEEERSGILSKMQQTRSCARADCDSKAVNDSDLSKSVFENSHRQASCLPSNPPFLC